MTKKNESDLVHVKINYSEALQSKRNSLSSQADLINIIKSIKKYNLLREKELTLKEKLYTKIKRINTKIKELKTSLPKPEIPEKLKPKDEKRYSYSKEKKIDNSLEGQLRDIQRRLNALSNS